MSPLKTMFAIAISLAFVSVASAGSGADKVTKILIHKNNVALVRLETSSDQPSCATVPEFAINLDTSGGQSQYSSLITALLNEHSVFILGDGNCSIWGDRETVRSVVIQPAA